MLFNSTDTIVAPITGSGPSAVAVIRLSGPDSFAIASQVFSPWPDSPEPRLALVGRYRFGETGIALPFPGRASFTGEDSVELSVHGGLASIAELLAACCSEGARVALPGEFSLRAFLNGKIDLSEAEAIADVVEAQTARQLRLASQNLHGGLKKSVSEISERLVGELAKLEATIDFSEELGDFDFEAAADSYRQIQLSLEELAAAGRRAHLARVGLRIALVGKPNVGKSSLFNRLLGSDRSIVTPIPGTTRDTVEESLDWNGYKVVLVDTAGIREVAEQVERLGIERSFSSAAAADLVFYLYDSAQGWTREDEEVLDSLGPSVLVIAHKSDLQSSDRGIPVSSFTGAGIGQLTSQALSRLSDVQDVPPVNQRQSVHLEEATDSVREAAIAASHLQPPDLISVLLRDAIDALGKVTGSTASADMLTEIFSRFCIGK